MDNFISSKIQKNLNGKRCPKCFRKYSKDSVYVVNAETVSNKEDFVFRKLKKSKGKLRYGAKIIGSTDWWAPFFIRRTMHPSKNRTFVPITLIEISCECGDFVEFEIRNNKF